jgi:hypothetical protein
MYLLVPWLLIIEIGEISGKVKASARFGDKPRWLNPG